MICNNLFGDLTSLPLNIGANESTLIATFAVDNVYQKVGALESSFNGPGSSAKKKRSKSACLAPVLTNEEEEIELEKSDRRCISLDI